MSERHLAQRAIFSAMIVSCVECGEQRIQQYFIYEVSMNEYDDNKQLGTDVSEARSRWHKTQTDHEMVVLYTSWVEDHFVGDCQEQLQGSR